MQLIVREIQDGGRTRVIGIAPSLGEAFAIIPGEVIADEEDAAHPNHWDVMTTHVGALRQFTIEPERR